MTETTSGKVKASARVAAMRRSGFSARTYLPAWRRPASHVFDQSAQKFLLRHAQTTQRDPLSAGSTVGSALDFGADGDVRALPVNGLNLHDHSVATARPSARAGFGDIRVLNQLRFRDNSTLDEGVGLADEYALVRLGCGLVKNQLAVAHQLHHGFHQLVAAGCELIRIGNGWRRDRPTATESYAAPDPCILLGAVAAGRSIIARIAYAAVLRVNALLLRLHARGSNSQNNDDSD